MDSKGRRPLLLPGSNRQMLNDINISLRHVRRNPQSRTAPDDYHKKAMEKIKTELKKFQVNDELESDKTSSCYGRLPNKKNEQEPIKRPLPARSPESEWSERSDSPCSSAQSSSDVSQPPPLPPRGIRSNAAFRAVTPPLGQAMTTSQAADSVLGSSYTDGNSPLSSKSVSPCPSQEQAPFPVHVWSAKPPLIRSHQVKSRPVSKPSKQPATSLMGLIPSYGMSSAGAVPYGPVPQFAQHVTKSQYSAPTNNMPHYALSLSQPPLPLSTNNAGKEAVIKFTQENSFANSSHLYQSHQSYVMSQHVAYSPHFQAGPALAANVANSIGAYDSALHNPSSYATEHSELDPMVHGVLSHVDKINFPSSTSTVYSTFSPSPGTNHLTIPNASTIVPAVQSQPSKLIAVVNGEEPGSAGVDLANESSSTLRRVGIEGKTLSSSPIPQRKLKNGVSVNAISSEEEEPTVGRYFSSAAYKFYMEQHIENVMKSYNQRLMRKRQLETELSKVKLSEQAKNHLRKLLAQKESNYIRLKRARLSQDMFDKICTLGVGAFGEVALVKKLDTEQLYAMKTLRKDEVLERNQAAHVKAERDILAEADNDWVVKLYYSFQDLTSLYFVMDYIPGGDMMSLLIKFGIFEEHLAKFYIAELVLAIESVHKMGFIHRDIKPDNILIDRDGHIKLTDFGLCTGFRWTHNSKYYQKGNHPRQDSMGFIDGSCEGGKLLERRNNQHLKRSMAHSLVGTPNYIAPEVLLRSGYTSCCDWWSVGVILYEMLVGQPPFYASNPAETQRKVIEWETSLKIPDESGLKPEATDIIRQLCCGAEQRLGASKGAEELKSHPYFQDIYYADLRRQKAPYIPKINSPTDTSNFDPVDQSKLKENQKSDDDRSKSSHRSKFVHAHQPSHAFYEFTFRRFFDDGGTTNANAYRPGSDAGNPEATNPTGKAPVYV